MIHLKTFFITLVAITTLNITVVQAQTTPQWPTPTRDAKAGTRWWWMGSAVTATDLQWNLQQMAQAGIGAVEVTPIYGVQGNERNELHYLSAAWFQALAAAQSAGDAHGVSIDMNGGTGWPFGGPWVNISEAAGKLVYKNETLTADGSTPLSWNVTAPEGNAPLNKVMAYQDDTTIDVTEHVEGQTLRWNPPTAGQWIVIAVYNGHTLQQVKRAAPGGEGYVLDHYDSTAVAHYLEHFEQAFQQNGARWPRSFFNDSYEVYGADWTPKFFDEFRKYRGYSLEEHMPELLGLRKDQDYQVLADYRQTLHDMLLNNFTRQWTQWAHSHGVSTRNQGHGSPGNLLDFYAAVDIPEIEGFGLTDFKISGLRTDPGFVRQNLSDFSTLKYASSAAHVTGKPLVSSETFTWLTEHFRTSLSQMKPDLDLMFCAGVNHVFFHGTTYTPRNAPWPGWKFYASIDMSPTNSIWTDAPALMQYIERCQSFLQMGSPDNDVLVYAPFLDAIHRNTSSRLLLFDINTLSQKMSELTTCVKHVEEAGLDCDYISDSQLMDVSVDANGSLVTAAGTVYRLMIVPASKYMPAEVKAHLDSLSAQGAIIVWGNDASQIDATQARPEAMRLSHGLRVIRRSNATGHHYFVANLQGRDVEAYVPLADSFQSAVIFNPMDGTMTDALLNDRGELLLSLRSGQSVIIQTYSSSVSCGQPYQHSVPVAPRTISGPWTLTLTDAATQQTTNYLLDSLTGWQTLSTTAAALMGTGSYETMFTADADLLSQGDCGFRLDLGDVRESARVWLNGDSLATLWSAPFTIDIPNGLVRQGENTLRIDVTNLPANRIRQMDIDGQTWRIFKDVNILDIINGNEGTSGITSYASWELMPSGLCASVTLTPLHNAAHTLTLRQLTFTYEGDNAFPTYIVKSATGTAISMVSITATDEDGQPYTGFTTSTTANGQLLLTVKDPSQGYIHFVLTDSEGNRYDSFLEAHGAYEPMAAYDFTSSEPPLCGWNKMADGLMSGFDGQGSVERYVAKKNGKVVTELFKGLTFTSEKANYFYFYPHYGMAVRLEGTMAIEAAKGTVAMLSHVTGQSGAYVAADSVVTFTTATEQGISISLLAQTNGCVYRHLALFKPRTVQNVINTATACPVTNVFYDLQGRRLLPTRQLPHGIYIRQGRKYIR